MISFNGFQSPEIASDLRAPLLINMNPIVTFEYCKKWKQELKGFSSIFNDFKGDPHIDAPTQDIIMTLAGISLFQSYIIRGGCF